ncbi:hypothetical protein BKA65DRAFT_596474 [Rhexocercosporidium sp. MPI-PUGE-AT-0058]|nr:hypothetical protein BKA65DRAFT_596474 [Rhexocercosporidium sp. MPI-PUGE-AT-0058]
MPPKKAPKAPPKPTKAKAPPKKKPAPPPPPPPPPKRRRAISRSPSEPIPEWDKGLSSLAARERKRFKLSRASLHEDLDEDYIAKQAELLMGESRNTWGVAEKSPIKGSRRPKPKSRGFKRGRGDIEEAYMEMFANITPQRRQAIPNCLSRSPVLRIPLEIRERIYEYLLVYQTPVMVKSDWTSLERNHFVSHSILLVCKQFAFEAASFFYKNNTFQSLIRASSSNPPLRFEDPGKLHAAFHSLFRNIVIDCSQTCWNLDWHEKAAEGLNSLFKAKPMIDTLTLVVVPQRVGMSDTALGMEVSPVTFADFLWYASPFMKAVRILAPKTFKVVVKKLGKKRLGMVVDLTYLRIGTAKDDLIANEYTLRLRATRLKAMRDELKGLKERFEEVFEDDERAIREGRCEVISAGNGGRDDNVLDGVARLGGREAESDEVERSSREIGESEEM